MGTRISLSQAYSVMPTIAEDIKVLVDKTNYIIEQYILRGFDYKVKEETYHFSFDDQDQANFTQEMIRASTVAMQGADAIAKYTAQWRGHKLDGSGSVTLSLTMQEFQALAMYAGTWKSSVLQYGWKVKNDLEACTTIAELNTVASLYDINSLYLAARDTDTYSLNITLDESGATVEQPKPGEVQSIEVPKLQFAQNDVISETGKLIPLGLTLADVPESLKDQIYHLHIFARNCEVHNFAQHPTYGFYKPDDPSFGEGLGVDANAATLQELVKNIQVAATDEYGLLDISIYPNDKGGMDTQNFYIQSSSLPSRVDAIADMEKWNKSLPPVPAEVLEEQKKTSEAINAAMASGMSIEDAIASVTKSSQSESGDATTTEPTEPPAKQPWQMTMYVDKVNFYKSTLQEFEDLKKEYAAMMATPLSTN